MLKRDGESCKYSVPDFDGKLTRSEFDSYNEAFETIKDELAALTQIKADLKELSVNPGVFAIPDAQFTEKALETKHSERGDLNLQWDIRSRLLKLTCTDVFLCERMTSEGKQFAVIERYGNESLYAKANGNTNVLLVSNDAHQAVQDYAARADHTLHFMASNMVATAQRVVWQRVASQNPSRVIRAISERCSKAIGDAQDDVQAKILERKLSSRQNQSVGQGV